VAGIASCNVKQTIVIYGWSVKRLPQLSSSLAEKAEFIYNIVMEQIPKKKILLLVLMACIVFSIALAEVLIAAEIEHNCIGPGCQICLKIEVARNLLRNLKLASIGLCLIVPLFHIIRDIPKYSETHSYHHSLVVLKIRFNS